MRTKPDNWYVQSAVAPVRQTEEGVEVMLVTSLKKKRWILPKGIVEPGMSPADSAAKEAWEEAGLKGTVEAHPLGHYTARKWGGVCRVDLFRMEVTDVSEEWLESDRRERAWFSPGEAGKLLKNREAARLVMKLGNPHHKLTILRHGKAEKPSEGQEDFDRNLTSRGKTDVEAVARSLDSLSDHPVVLIASPARRAARTAKILQKVLGGTPLVERPEIYEATVTDLLALLRDLPDELGHVALVGHNPGLSELVRTLSGAPVEDLPTSGAAVLDVGAAQWSAIVPGGSKVLDVRSPGSVAEGR